MWTSSTSRVKARRGSPGHAGVLGLVLVLAGARAFAQTGEVTVDKVEKWNLVVGQQKILGNLQSASTPPQDDKTLDIRDDQKRSRIIVVAAQPGDTSFTVTLKDGTNIRYDVSVRPRRSVAAVDVSDNVRLDLYFVQLSHKDSLQVGIGWPAVIGGPGVGTASLQVTKPATGSTSTTFSAQFVNQLLPRLDFAHATGWVRILRHATLVVANGENGSYNSGGEVNVLVAGALTTGVHKIPFGSAVQVQPTYDRASGRVQLQVTADVSELEEGQDVPGRTTTTVDTVVNLELGQGIMLAGLQSERQGHTKAGLPWLSQVPILGVLFGSHGARQEEVENVLFIVPSVMETVSLENRNLVREALRDYREFDGDLGEVDFLKPSPGQD